MPSRFLRVFASLALLTAACSHEHGPLSDTPDPTSLGNAKILGQGGISTAYGVASRSDEAPKGTTQGVYSPLTTEARPAPSLVGTLVDTDVGNNTWPNTSNAMQAWTSGPNLPVEPWNQALASPEGEGGGEGRGGPHSRARP